MQKTNASRLILQSDNEKDKARIILSLISDIREEWHKDEKLVKLLNELEETVMKWEMLLRENPMITVDLRLQVTIASLSRLLRKLWFFFTG